MILGRSYKASVVIGEVEIGDIDVTVGFDGTMTLTFQKGDNTIGDLDELFRSEPNVSINGEVTESRKLQAYRVDAIGIVEVSFFADEEGGVEDAEVN